MKTFLLIALVVMLLCLGVVIYIGVDLYKITAKMRRECKRCARRGQTDAQCSSCFFDESHPYFKKIPRRSKNAKH